MDKQLLVDRAGNSIIGLPKLLADLCLSKSPEVTAMLKNFIVQCYVIANQSQFMQRVSMYTGQDTNVEDVMFDVVKLHVDQCISDIEKMGRNAHLDNLISCISDMDNPT